MFSGDKESLPFLSGAGFIHLSRNAMAAEGKLTQHQRNLPQSYCSAYKCCTTFLSQDLKLPCEPSTPTRQVKCLVHHELLSKADVAEVLLALADGDDLPTLLKHLHDDLLRPVLWQPSYKHCLAAWGPLSCGWRGKI